MLQPKKPNFDKLLKDLYKKQQSLEKIDEENQFKSNYTPQSLKYQKQRKYLNDKKSEIKTDNSTNKDKEFNKDIYDQKEWDDKKWGYAEDAASIAELGNFVPHPVAQGVGKVGAIASTALSARKAKLAYDNEDYKNMGLNLGMMGLSAGLGSRVVSRSTPKLSKLDSFERAIAPKSFKSNIVNGYELGRITSDVPSYINVLNQKPVQSVGNLLLNRGALGAVGVDLNTDFSIEQNENTQNAMGGNIKNMRRYAMGGDLTQFNEGGTHSQNPLGGVPIGNNNSVEEGETKQNNFIYSNRIFLDSNIVSQYNLPKSLVGKSVADATKFIDNKFKGRNDKISQSTKNGMLSKIAEAQEAMKPQEPEMEQSQEGMIDPTQMAFGGYANRQMEDGGYYDQNNPYFMQNPGVQQPGIGPMNQIQPVSQLTQANSLSQIKPFSTGNQLPTASAVPDTAGAIGGGLKEMSGKTGLGLSSALGAASTAIDLGKTAFGKPAQDTSGLAPSAKVNSGGMIAGSAMKGASAGMAFGPLGAGIGAAVGGVAGLLGSGKAKKAALKNSNNFARRTNAQFSDQYAMGGKINQMYNGGDYYNKNNPYFMTNPGEVPPIGQETVSSNKLVLFPKPKYTADYNTNIIQNVHDAIGITPDIPGYGNAWGDKSNEALRQKIISSGQTPTKSKYNFSKEDMLSKPLSSDMGKILGLTPEGYKFNPLPIEPITKEDPIITPTQTLAGFEAYADAKQAEEAAAAEAIKNKKSIAGKALSYTNDNLGNIARYAPIAANALQLAQLKKPQGERLDRLGNRYKPEYVDEAVMRNIVDQEANNQINALTQSGASQGAVRNAILGAGLNKTKALSDAYMNAAAQNRATNDRAQTFNLGVDQVNLQQSNTEKENFARDQAAYRNAKREYITGIGEGIGDIGKEQTYKKIIAKTTGYKWDGEYVKSPDGTVVTDPTTGKPMTEEKLKEIQSIKDKKALGGYLIKNKVK